jgi:hypothetical protein
MSSRRSCVYVVEVIPYDNPDAFNYIDSVWTTHAAASKRQNRLQPKYYGVRVWTRVLRSNFNGA